MKQKQQKQQTSSNKLENSWETVMTSEGSTTNGTSSQGGSSSDFPRGFLMGNNPSELFLDDDDNDYEGDDEDYTKTGHELESPFILESPRAVVDNSNNTKGTSGATGSKKSFVAVEQQKNGSGSSSGVGNRRLSSSSSNNRPTTSTTAGTTSSSSNRPTLRKITSGAIPNKEETKKDSLSSVSLDFLQEQGYTKGLIRSLQKNKCHFPLRVWLVDNSESMNKRDGHMIMSNPNSGSSSHNSNCHPNSTTTSFVGRMMKKNHNDAVQFVQCTRWEEMQQTVDYHCQMAAISKSTTVFKMLNNPNIRGVSQQFSIAKPISTTNIPGVKSIVTKNSNNHHTNHIAPTMMDLYQDLEIAQSTMSQIRPIGHTPLNQSLLEIKENIIQLIPKLKESASSSSSSKNKKQSSNNNTTSDDTNSNSNNNTNSNNTTTKKVKCRRVAIVIATDGKPTDSNGHPTKEATNEFCQTLLSLKELPVWIVIRLCTDDEQIVNYWNSFDVDGLDIEVIDDYVSEAQEVYENNKWLNYALPLHRMREMGFYNRVLDVLDERTVTKNELVQFLCILFGRTDVLKHGPNPYEEWDDFCLHIQQLSLKEKMQWNPITHKLEPWINYKHLKKLYHTKSNNNNNNTTTTNDTNNTPRRTSLLFQRFLKEPNSPVRNSSSSSTNRRLSQRMTIMNNNNNANTTTGSSSRQRFLKLSRLLLKKQSQRNLMVSESFQRNNYNEDISADYSVEVPCLPFAATTTTTTIKE